MEEQVYPFSSAVRFESVTCQIGKRKILDRVNLTIKRGTITGVLGPNGAGKTTLLSSIIELRHPTSGTITVFGEKLPVRNKKLRQKIGVVFQETALYDELTAFENLSFASSLYNVPDAKQRIIEVLELLSLSERAHERVRNLSGGMQRRVAIARALLHAPALLIIDEPTLGVDVEARHAIWSHLRVLKSAGTTIIVSTNYLDEALALCDTVAVLRAGQLLTCETPGALVARAGSCLDIECSEAAGTAIAQALATVDGILRINQAPTGLSVFLHGNTVPDDVMRLVLQSATINGFRARGADLAEVFRALEEVSS
ncbi:ABC transporter ATP-binding protein [Ktedonosporobacter rubrisoli]|uniref:ABC transporter ATP-binding protein n=1 Tax=Ktedonosporobacter rubrisoli TaxID=2509675 RepID=A0A4P6JPR9_KTERU|nr:ABC transporter ATP-binding protein [Ktedonosporobacter rubrisoli]QBD77388.1 ABC transporter ATP-binding protein [Ktedonosporobacter rubrisoli]